MDLSEGINIVLTFGDMRKGGNYTFTKFNMERFSVFVQEICREFTTDIGLVSEDKNK